MQNAQKIDRKKLKKNMISIKILGLDSGESEKWKNRTRVSIITKNPELYVPDFQ